MVKIKDMICERADKPKTKLNCIMEIDRKKYFCELYSSRKTGAGWWKVKQCRRW